MVDRIGFKPDYAPTAPNYVDPNNPCGQPSCFPPPNFHPQYPPHFGGPLPPHFGHHPHPPHFGPSHPHFPNYGHSEPAQTFPSHPPPPSPNYPAPPFGPPNSYPHHYPPPPGPPDGSYVVRGYYWVATNARQGVPPSAVRGGVDQDGTTIYVGRAHHEGDWIPAKVIPEKDVAYVAYGGKEHAKSEFQVLCEQTFEWVPTSGTNVPPEAVVGGQTSEGEPLYVGRVYHAGSHTVGKVHPSHGTCYIPFGGEELGFADYEVLVLRG